MKITKEKLKQIIKEELETFTEDSSTPALDKDQRLTTTADIKARRASATGASSERITKQERALIDQLRALLVKYATDYNLASGSEFALLKKVAQMMSDKLKDPQAESPGLEPEQ